MGLGHVKFSVDLESVEKSLQTKKGQEELKEFVDVIAMTVETPAKVKINTKRNPSNNETDEILIIEEQVA